MPDLYILMILDKDPFGYDYMMYSIRNKCEEIKELDYEDGLRFYYFYTDGSKGGSNEIKTMLHYIRDSREENAIDDATKEVHRFTKKVKVHPEVRKGYMLWEEYEYLWKKKLREEVKEEMKDEVKEEVREEVKDEVREEVREEVKEEVKEKVREEVKDEVREEIKEAAKVEAQKELREELKAEGMAEEILEVLEEYGEVPGKLKERILEKKSLPILKCWLKAAVKADSIEAFEQEI